MTPPNTPNTTQIFLDTLRAALQPEASPEARAQGATVCRALLTALTTPAGQPLYPDGAHASPAAHRDTPHAPPAKPPRMHAAPLDHAMHDTTPPCDTTPPTAMPSMPAMPTMPAMPAMPAMPVDQLAGLNPATLAAALRQLTPDQILDLAISRLRAALPAADAAATPNIQPLRFHLIPLPQLP